MGTLSEDDDEQDQTATTEQDVAVPEDEAAHEEPAIEVVEEDERAAHSDEDAPRAEHKPRESAKERRDRARIAKERDKRELTFLRAELARQDQAMRELRDGQIASRITDVDNRIAVAKREADTFSQIQAAAIGKNEGRDAVDAQMLREEAQRKLAAAQYERQQLQQVRQQPAPPTFLPLAKEFLA